MAILSDPNRIDAWARFMRENDNSFGTLTKAELRAAVNAIDQWIEDNASAFNAAIPQPARSALTTRQKARLFFFVARLRFEVL